MNDYGELDCWEKLAGRLERRLEELNPGLIAGVIYLPEFNSLRVSCRKPLKLSLSRTYSGPLTPELCIDVEAWVAKVWGLMCQG